jgi:hypothetical protein
MAANRSAQSDFLDPIHRHIVSFRQMNQW